MREFPFVRHCIGYSGFGFDRYISLTKTRVYLDCRTAPLGRPLMVIGLTWVQSTAVLHLFVKALLPVYIVGISRSNKYLAFA